MTGVFEALHTSGLTSEARVLEQKLARDIDTAVFRARERFGSFLANSRTDSEFKGRLAYIKPDLMKVVAEVTDPIPGTMRRVVAALKPDGMGRPTQAKSASRREPEQQVRVGSTQKTAWLYDDDTKLYTHTGSFKAFSCPGCGTEQEHLGLNPCKCGRTFNSWVVRNSSTNKSASPSDVLMCREIKMRGDQFKLAGSDSLPPWMTGDGDKDKDDDKKDDDKDDKKDKKESKVVTADIPPMGAQLPPAGTTDMDVPPSAPPTTSESEPSGPVEEPSPDSDMDVPGTEGSPLDQIQDALQNAIYALKEVQMLSVGDMRTASAAANLRTAMNKFWGLQQSQERTAKKLAYEASTALKKIEPKKIDKEAEFLGGWDLAAEGQRLPEKASRTVVEGYIAFLKRADSPGQPELIAGDFAPPRPDGVPNSMGPDWANDAGGTVPAPGDNTSKGDPSAGTGYSNDFVNSEERRNQQGQSDPSMGPGSSLPGSDWAPRSARKAGPKGR